MTFIEGIMQNKIFISAVLAWATAQFLKVLASCFKQKKVDMERIVGAGGMPSSHSALVVSLTTAIGLNHGWSSPMFAMACILAGIVMYDAAGVRRAAGKQAKVLNKLVTESPTRHTAEEGELKELLGHTPVEVLAGAVLGLCMAYVIYLYW